MNLGENAQVEETATSTRGFASAMMASMAMLVTRNLLPFSFNFSQIYTSLLPFFRCKLSRTQNFISNKKCNS